MTFQTGEVVGGRYRLGERVAAGGMGEVWRGRDETLDRTVAIKLLRPDTTDASGFVDRFRAEARHSAALTHPNIGVVFDFGEDEHTAYLVMEFLDGAPLSQIIAERAPLDPAEVTAILGQTAHALQAAHDSGVVHRDVKPGNIIVDAADRPKLTDFGIARALQGSTMTQTGEVIGTPHYLSPEQAQGQPADPRSDIYALGVVGYEMLTGERPFTGDSMITAALAHVSQPVPELPPDVPEPLRTTLTSALAKDPAGRPQSAAEFAEALALPQGEVPPRLARTASSAADRLPPPTGVAPAAGGPPTLAFSTRQTLRTTGTTGRSRGSAAGPLAAGRWPWWVPAAAAALAVLVVSVLAVSLGRGGGEPVTPAQTPTDTAPDTPATSVALTPSATATTTAPAATPVASPAPAPPAVQPGTGSDPGAGTGGGDTEQGSKKDSPPGRGGNGKGKK